MGHLHQQKVTTKAPHGWAQSSHSLHTATCSISLLKSPEQSPAASEHPKESAPAQVTLMQHPQHRGRAMWPLPSAKQDHLPLFLQSHKATGATLTPGLPCRPLPTSLGLPSLTPNQCLKGTNLSRCWTLQAVCSSHYP